MRSAPRTQPDARELGIAYGTVCLSCGRWHYTYTISDAIERPCPDCQRRGLLERRARLRDWLVVVALTVGVLALTLYVEAAAGGRP